MENYRLRRPVCNAIALPVGVGLAPTRRSQVRETGTRDETAPRPTLAVGLGGLDETKPSILNLTPTRRFGEKAKNYGTGE